MYVRAEASDVFSVHNVSTGLNYTSIQGAIDAPETLDGNTILVDAGTYNTTLIVDKSLTIIGSENTTVINGGGASLVVHVAANDVHIEGFAVRGGLVGVYFDHSSNSIFRENNVTGMVYYYAIYAAYSENLTIDQNIVGPNSCSGILITDSSGFKVSSNHVLGNQGYGINGNASINGLIEGNDVYENSFDGIGLSKGCENITITGNNVSYNMLFGINVIDPDCLDNTIYDNNFVNNSKQASVSSANFWDNGLEGNYWSDYAGVDEDHNGIGDLPYNLSADNVDDYPLMGVFSVFETSLGLDVDVVSNSSITAFAYFVSNGTIRMHVLSSAMSQTYGFCRVRVPHGLMTEPYNVTVDGAAPLYMNSTLHDDGGSRWVYLAYQQSEREVLIQGRPPPPTVFVLSPENKTYTVSDVPLTFVVDQPSSWLAYSLDGQNNVTVTGNTTLLSVSNGTHSLVVYARNSFGDTGASGMVSFTVSATTAWPFWLYVAAAVVAVTAVLAVVLVYVKKMRRRRSKSG